jgi:hypothetical protein
MLRFGLWIVWYLNLQLPMQSVPITTKVRTLFMARFNNISTMLWPSGFLVKETGVPGESHRPVPSHRQTLSHYVVSSTPCHEQGSNFSGYRH